MKNIKRIFAAVALVGAMAAMLTGCGGGASNHLDAADPGDAFATGTHHAVVQVEGYDPFTITIDSDNAPLTSSNFLHLASDGFYDGVTFHRVVDRFCLQGGDPDGDGKGGSDTSIKGEFSANKVDNALADNFDRGVVAMARTNAPDSASSQFFVTLTAAAAPSLNGQYAAFGTVDEEGMKAVDAIVADALPNADARSGMVGDQSARPVIASITVVD